MVPHGMKNSADQPRSRQLGDAVPRPVPIARVLPLRKDRAVAVRIAERDVEPESVAALAGRVDRKADFVARDLKSDVATRQPHQARFGRLLQIEADVETSRRIEELWPASHTAASPTYRARSPRNRRSPVTAAHVTSSSRPSMSTGTSSATRVSGIDTRGSASSMRCAAFACAHASSKPARPLRIVLDTLYSACLTAPHCRRVRRQVIESSAWPLRAIGLYDRRQIARRRAVQNDAVATEIELAVDAANALLRRTARGRRQPGGGNQLGHLLEFFGGRALVDGALKVRHEFVLAEAFQAPPDPNRSCAPSGRRTPADTSPSCQRFSSAAPDTADGRRWSRNTTTRALMPGRAPLSRRPV